MATNAANFSTLLDLAKLKDPDGSITQIVEILNQTNGINEDIHYVEGNLDTGHQHTMRTGIPAPTYTRLYGGVQPTKSTSVQVIDSTAMMEAYAEVDARLLNMNNNKAAWRMSEDMAHIEGFAEELANGLFFNDESIDPEKYTGLAPRYNTTSAVNGDNVILGGGVGGDNRSMWLVNWGPRKVYGIVPKGTVAGMQVEDLGKDVKTLSDGSLLQVFRTHFSWNVGLALEDWRHVVRVPNIDASLLAANSSLHTPGTGFANSTADLSDLLHKAISRLPNMNGNPVIYMARDVLDALRRQVSAKTMESTLTMENVGGTMITKFMDISLKRVDALATDEALVS